MKILSLELNNILYACTCTFICILCIGSNCPRISGTVPDFLPLSRVPEGPIVCPGSKLGSCTMSHFLLQVIRMTANNLIAGRAQSLKKAWSLVLKSVVWAEFK